MTRSCAASAASCSRSVPTPGIRERIDSLARREAACCPFAGYRVDTVGEEVIFAITTNVVEMLDAFYALPDDDPTRARAG